MDSDSFDKTIQYTPDFFVEYNYNDYRYRITYGSDTLFMLLPNGDSTKYPTYTAVLKFCNHFRYSGAIKFKLIYTIYRSHYSNDLSFKKVLQYFKLEDLERFMILG